MFIYVHSQKSVEEVVRGERESLPVVFSKTPIHDQQLIPLCNTVTVTFFTYPENDENMIMVIDYKEIRLTDASTSQEIPIDDAVLKERFTHFITNHNSAELPTPGKPHFDEIGRHELVTLLFLIVLDVVDTMDGTVMSEIPFSKPAFVEELVFSKMEISKARVTEMFAHMPGGIKDDCVAFQCSPILQ